MNCNTPRSPVLHDFLPEFSQVHVHWVHWWCYLTILSSAPLSSFCLQYFPAFQGLFQWVSSSRQVAKSEDYLTHCRIILAVCVLVAQSCLTLCGPMDCQAPLSMGFFRQEYWRGLPVPSPRIFLTQRSNLSLLRLLHCRQILYHWATREAQVLSLS